MNKLAAATALLALLLLGCPSEAAAQFGGAPRPGVANRPARGAQGLLDRMTAHLKLTRPQQKKIRPILEKMYADSRALVMDRSLTTEQKRARSQANRSTAYNQIKVHLTPQQRKKLSPGLVPSSAPTKRK